ncbi:hypothetical protein OJ253_3508 [Cryptosporidium canis]|uniref:Uncharacterized protein n=1 Tax=Cryptosporidium canis TaxID=195482 RepID=A0A9D5DFW2_9CRYT|nr:hypothetical protein OJ253_3508 [Cryptosporidium canis]
MQGKPVSRRGVYGIQNDVSSLYHETHQHSSRAVLKRIDKQKQVRFDSSPPEVFEYEALDQGSLLVESCLQRCLEKSGLEALSAGPCADSSDQLDAESQLMACDGEWSPSQGGPLTLPIPNRRELFELENCPSDLNQDCNLHSQEPLRVEGILSIDGKYIQKSAFPEAIYDSDPELSCGSSGGPCCGLIDLKDIRIEIDKIPVRREDLDHNTRENGLDSQNFQLVSGKFDCQDLIDMQSTTESLSFL